MLDQIEDMSAKMQLSMLKIIDSKKVSPAEGVYDFPLNVSIMAASRYDLARLVEAGKFNDKLYFWSMKPVSEGYATVEANPVGYNVQNIFTNLAASNGVDSCIIQKRVHGEDMGQSLATLGVDNGFYVVWPVFEPLTAP